MPVRGVGGVRAHKKVLHKQRYSQKAYFSSGKVFNSHESRGNHQEVKVKFRAASWIVQTEDYKQEEGQKKDLILMKQLKAMTCYQILVGG